MHKIKVLPGGVRVIYEFVPTARSVSVGTWIKSGSVFEEGPFHGISHFIEHMLFKATGRRSAFDISTLSELMGGHLNAFTSRDCTCIYTKTLPEFLGDSLDLISDMLFGSLFDEKDIETEKSVIAEEIHMYNDTHEELVHDILADACYPEHPAGNTILGTEKSIKKFNRQLILEHINNHFSGKNIVVSVAGNFDETELLSLCEKYYGPAISCGKGVVVPDAKLTQNKVCVKKSGSQSHVALAFEGYPYDHKDRFALSLVSNVLGGSTSSRLFQKIREKLGLAYSVYSCPNVFVSASYISVYSGCLKSNLDKVTNLILEEMQNVFSNGITSEELEFAKKQMECSFVLSSESCEHIMSSLGRQLLLHDSVKTNEDIIEEIQLIDMDSVSRASKLLDPSLVTIAQINN